MNSLEIIKAILPIELVDHILTFSQIKTNNLNKFEQIYNLYDLLQTNLVILENKLLRFEKKLKSDKLYNDFDYTGEIFSFRIIESNELVEYCLQAVDKEYGYNRIDIFKYQYIDFFLENQNTEKNYRIIKH